MNPLTLKEIERDYELPVLVIPIDVDFYRGSMAGEFGWRGFIRATHVGIQPPKDGDWLRRHSQVYLDAETYQW